MTFKQKHIVGIQQYKKSLAIEIGAKHRVSNMWNIESTPYFADSPLHGVAMDTCDFLFLLKALGIGGLSNFNKVSMTADFIHRLLGLEI